MGTRFGVLAAAISVAALTAGMAIPAAGSPSNRSTSSGDRHSTFSVTATMTEFNQLDLGATGSSLGDEIVFAGSLLRHGTEVGHQGGVCTIVSLQRQEAQCVATYSLRGGQITAQTVIVLGSATPYSVAVTGGTGRYARAEGTVRVRPATATKPTGTLTFHLED